ncbi:methyltransferase domain-containing protein [Burkholderia cepacia]|nr:methyltransferase domain-containing protein [Burkholderia cepacia]
MKAFELHRGYCVEIGSLEYLSSKVIWSFFPGSTVRGTESDLRYDPLPFADNSVDNVICTEVIEHISDISYRQATTLNGIFFFLDEVYRVLRVGGACADLNSECDQPMGNSAGDDATSAIDV